MARNYYLAVNPLDNTKKAPCSLLDLVFHPHKQNTKLSYHVSMLSYYTLDVLYELDQEMVVHQGALNEFIQTALDNFHAKQHLTTDHLIIKITITDKLSGDNFSVAYISLENSIRSVIGECDFCSRLDNFKKLFQGLTDQGVSLFFFSEGCRDIFSGPVKFVEGVPITPVKRYWYSIRSELERDLGLSFLGCAPNNAQGNGLSFGVEAYVVNHHRHHIVTWAPLQLTQVENGSGAVKVVVQVGQERVSLIGVHMPLDFKRGREDNTLRFAVEGLRDHVNKYPVDIIFGDFNSIAWRYDLIKETLNNCSLVADDKWPTFFPSFCDAEAKEEITESVTSLIV